MKQQILVPEKMHVTTAQIGQLLAILGHLANYSLAPLESGRAPLSSSVQDSVDSTLIRTLNQLDNLLDDKSRWGSDMAKGLEDSLLSVYQEQQLALREQRIAQAQVMRPCFQLKPELSIEDGKWFARYSAGSPLFGAGNSPEEAFEQFDRAFEAISADTTTAKRKHKKA